MERYAQIKVKLRMARLPLDKGLELPVVVGDRLAELPEVPEQVLGPMEVDSEFLAFQDRIRGYVLHGHPMALWGGLDNYGLLGQGTPGLSDYRCDPVDTVLVIEKGLGRGDSVECQEYAALLQEQDVPVPDRPEVPHLSDRGGAAKIEDRFEALSIEDRDWSGLDELDDLW